MGKISETILGLAPACRPEYLAAFTAAEETLLTRLSSPLRRVHFLAHGLYLTRGGSLLRESLALSREDLLRLYGPGQSPARVDEAVADTIVGDERKIAARIYDQPLVREFLGNQGEDSWNLRGGGWHMTTGRSAWRQAGDRCGVSFIAAPEQIESERWLVVAALHMWDIRGLGPQADAGDLGLVARGLTGGYWGLDEIEGWCLKVWERLRPEGGPELWELAAPTTEMVRLQQALGALGAPEPPKATGRFSPETRAAVKWFQAHAGLTPDGWPGVTTKAQIMLRVQGRR